jgi:hypothetical protein
LMKKVRKLHYILYIKKFQYYIIGLLLLNRKYYEN